MATSFVEVYNRFLGQITDDLYVELTPEDTVRDLRNILIDSLPGFEFPRKNLLDYSIKTEIINEEDVQEDDFIIGVIWGELDEEMVEPPQKVMVERSTFTADLTAEEIMIISKLMMNNWLQRQITSIENTRMKYSGADFKMTSQANHLSKLITLQDKVQQQAHHFQRLYKRRRLNENSEFESNWDVFKRTSYYDD